MYNLEDVDSFLPDFTEALSDAIDGAMVAKTIHFKHDLEDRSPDPGSAEDVF